MDLTLCNWTSRETPAQSLMRQLSLSVEDSASMVFSTDAVCALWPMWSSGVVQGSLRLSGSRLMVRSLSLCAYYVRVYCMSPHAHGLIIVILTDTFTIYGWRLVSYMVDYPSNSRGSTVLSQLLHEWLTSLFCFLLLLSPPWCFVAEQTTHTAFDCSLIAWHLNLHIWMISSSLTWIVFRALNYHQNSNRGSL